MSSEYFDETQNRVSDGVTARASDVNALRDEVGVGFEKLPGEQEMKQGKVTYAIDTGVADAYVVVPIYPPTSYADGLHVRMRPANSNTGPCTINVNSLGIKEIRRGDNLPADANDIVAGVPVDLYYSSATGYFHMQSNSGASASASADAIAAAASASAALVSENNAAAYEAAAAAGAGSAATSEANAATSATNSATSASAAATSETNAAASAAAASASVTAATTQASNAATSASNAATSETNAANSASAASTSATNASNSASAASTSATNAANSASAASTSATNASNSATAAAASATAAAQSATDAANTPVASPTHAASSKTTPVDADEIPLIDSAASWVLKKLTWANLKSGIWSALGALINGGTAKTTPVYADEIAIADSAASNATKKLSLANLFGNLADIAFTGTARRITGDFSNATVANRVMFQTSTVNANTSVSAIPNGTAVGANIAAYNSSTDPSNAGMMQISVNGTESQVLANRSGTGTYLPMTFYTSGLERMRIDTSGFTGIATTAPVFSEKFAVSSYCRFGTTAQTIFGDGGTLGIAGCYTNHPLSFRVNNLEKAQIDTGGNLRVTTAAGLGYGTGAGGTVTQATNKSTSVTLNKPCGQITMNNAALGANTAVTFQVVNSLVAATDTVVVNFTSATVTANYTVIASPAAGSFYVCLRNMTAGSLSDAVVINFAIIKGATS